MSRLYVYRELGNSVVQTGFFMTMTLLGDVVISLVLTVIADRIGRRRMLALGSILMAASGVVFALSNDFWVLLLASVIGVISPSGNEIGPFKAIEESTIAQLVSSTERSTVLAYYILFGTAGTALGTISCGWVIHELRAVRHWPILKTYKLVFWVYAAFGIVKLVLSLILSSACEAAHTETRSSAANLERQPLLPPEAEQQLTEEEQASKIALKKRWAPKLSKDTSLLIVKLAILFGMDSFASGLVPSSWIIYFFHQKFGLDEEWLGNLFFVTNILSTASTLVASSLSRRIGLVKTMVFTHTPASIALILIPVPGNMIIAMALLLFRSSTSSMDQAPRQAFLAAAVLPSERTTVMGIINITKTLCQSAGPGITGTLAGSGRFGLAFVTAGALKIMYDALLLTMFISYRTAEDKAKDVPPTTAESNGESEERGT